MHLSTLPAIAMNAGGPNTFELETQAVLSELRESLAATLEPFRPEVIRAADLKRLLKLDAKLAWSVYTAATADDLHSLVAVLPGVRAMSRYFEAVASRGVPETDIARAKAAFERFEQAVRIHAADRDVFDAMVSSLSPSSDDVIDEKLRKRMFIDHSIFWGVRCKVTTLSLFERPGAEPGTIDTAILLECLQMQQLREKQQFNLNAEIAFGDAADPDKLRAKLMTPTGGGDLSPMVLLEEFCSGQTPKLTPEGAGLAGQRTALQFSGLGRAAAVDLVMAQTARGAAAAQDGTNSAFAVHTRPSEISYSDLYVPAGTTDPHSVRARVFASRSNASKVYERNPEDLVPMKAVGFHCGRVRFPIAHGREKLSRSPVAIPESPNHIAALTRVVEQLGWDDVEYDVYRCVMKYPVMQTLVEVIVNPARTSPPQSH